MAPAWLMESSSDLGKNRLAIDLCRKKAFDIFHDESGRTKLANKFQVVLVEHVPFVVFRAIARNATVASPAD
jgi:hypothetical protein